MNKPSLEEAIARVRGLPTLPTVLRQILATTADPESSVIDLGRHIASDQSLSAGLLKMVNSAAYGYNRQIDSITAAIVILGFTEIRNLALATTTFRAFGNAKGPNLTQLWRHSLATAMAGERLAKFIQFNREAAFVAGLLHDIGKVVFHAIYPGHAKAACVLASSNSISILEAENEVFGINHAQVGGLLAEHWQLPVSVVETIRYHHEGSANASDQRLISVTATANWITYQAGLGDPCNHSTPSPTADSLTILSEEQKEKTVQSVVENSGLIDEFLGVID